MIVAAAIEYQGLIFTKPKPSRHHHIIHQLDDYVDDYFKWGEVEQGFIDHAGVFYIREAAYKHCQLVGQPLVRRLALLEAGENVYNGEELFSEDLW